MSQISGSPLHVLGLDLDGVQITHIIDDVNYLDSIGRAQQVALLCDSRIAEAQAEAEAQADIGAISAREAAELPMQTEWIGQMHHQLQADVVAPAEAACHRPRSGPLAALRQRRRQGEPAAARWALLGRV